MSKHAVVLKLESAQLKKDIPDFSVGDTVKVHTRIVEGNKERIQVFMGTVIARTGSGLSETFSLHRVAYNEGMERVFILNSPKIAKIEVLKKGKVRKAKLYYLRGATGKAAKIKGSIAVQKKKVVAEPKEEVKEAAEPKEKAEAKEVVEAAPEEKAEAKEVAPEKKAEAVETKAEPKEEKAPKKEEAKEAKEEKEPEVKDEPKDPQADK